jgi:hypothetical protein
VVGTSAPASVEECSAVVLPSPKFQETWNVSSAPGSAMLPVNAIDCCRTPVAGPVDAGRGLTLLTAMFFEPAELKKPGVESSSFRSTVIVYGSEVVPVGASSA